MQAPDKNQPLGSDFNLESYRNLLERLQQSKRNVARLDKTAPPVAMQQTA